MKRGRDKNDKEYKYQVSVCISVIVIILCTVGILFVHTMTANRLMNNRYGDLPEPENTTESFSIKDKGEYSYTYTSKYPSDNKQSKNKKTKVNSKAKKSTTTKAVTEKPPKTTKETTSKETSEYRETTEKVTVYDEFFIYSQNGKTLHSRSCPYAANLDGETAVIIPADKADELLLEGYEFCSYCNGFIIGGCDE
ncbi:MAG: hypothetical protein E7514_01985 [Ruminococcaceae bacterium]|nr:hypothetical protein [Oscillospiraceae bacterium]